MNRNYPGYGILLVLLPVVTGCGGGGKSFMTAPQAQSAYGDVLTAFSEAAGGDGLARSNRIERLRLAEAAVIQRAILKGAQASLPVNSASPELRTNPDAALPAFTYKCPSGGSIVVTGSYSGTETSASVNIVETIDNCSDSGVTFNGDPDIALSETGTESGSTITVNLTLTGGLSSGSSSCSIDVKASASVNDNTDSGTVMASGSFCGQSINVSEAITL